MRVWVLTMVLFWVRVRVLFRVRVRIRASGSNSANSNGLNDVSNGMSRTSLGVMFTPHR